MTGGHRFLRIFSSSSGSLQRIIQEKQRLDILASRHARDLVERLPPRGEFCVFSVVTECCVGFVARGLLRRGKRLGVVSDARSRPRNPMPGIEP